MQKKQAFEMTSQKERHQADREWVGGATPFSRKRENTAAPPLERW